MKAEKLLGVLKKSGALPAPILELDNSSGSEDVRIQLVFDATTAESPHDLAAWVRLEGEKPYLEIVSGYPTGPSDDQVTVELAGRTEEELAEEVIVKLRELGLLDRSQRSRHFDPIDLLPKMVLRRYVKLIEYQGR